VLTPDGRSLEITDDPAVAFDDAEVIIDFSVPEATLNILTQAVKQKLPMVIGTTGFSAGQMSLFREAASVLPLVVASNMSLGINLFKMLIRALVPHLPADYDLEIVERHHNQKQDNPSGTAIDMATLIRQCQPRLSEVDWSCGRPRSTQKRKPEDLVVHAVRAGGVIGEHNLYASGNSEEIVISHRAFDRTVFVTGALAAAVFVIKATPGFYSMQDVIKEQFE